MVHPALDRLWPYQREAVLSILDHLRQVRSTLIVMATGSGKTEIFVGLASLAPGRVLVLAHRNELILQAARRIVRMTGYPVGIEQAGQHAAGERFVVASVQSLRRKRLRRWRPDAFSLIIVDECHHSAAPTYRRILQHFDQARVLGVTATPERSDGQALSKIFETVAFEYNAWSAITDGVLVPPKLLRIVLEDVDLSGWQATASGDLSSEQLDAALSPEQVLHGIARPLLERAGDRKTLAFLPGVKSAYGLARVLNAYRPGCAQAVDYRTPKGERRQRLAQHRAGEFQFLCNCLVLTEGYDSPAVACVAIARPTKSRSLYAQMLGRGLRRAPNKRDCLVLDFVDISRRHDLAGPESVLGEADSFEVVAEARREIGEGQPHPLDLREVLQRSRARVRYRVEQEELRFRRRPRLRQTVGAAEVWRLFGLDPGALRGGGPPATPHEVASLRRYGVEPGDLDHRAAALLLRVMIGRAARKLATPARLLLLSEHLEVRPDLPEREAEHLWERLAQDRWDLPTGQAGGRSKKIVRPLNKPQKATSQRAERED